MSVSTVQNGSVAIAASNNTQSTTQTPLMAIRGVSNTTRFPSSLGPQNRTAVVKQTGTEIVRESASNFFDGVKNYVSESVKNRNPFGTAPLSPADQKQVNHEQRQKQIKATTQASRENGGGIENFAQRFGSTPSPSSSTSAKPNNGTMGATPTSPNTPAPPIFISNVEQLNLIGTNASYPIGGHYILAADIDAANMTKPIPHFKGQFDGQGHTITNLKDCLFGRLRGEGKVFNLTISDAKIVMDKPNRAQNIVGPVACKTKGGSLSSIMVKDSRIELKNARRQAAAGALVGEAKDKTRFTDIQVVNNTISVESEKDSGMAGGVAGKTERGVTLTGIQLKNNKVTVSTTQFPKAGGIVGDSYQVNISNSTATGNLINSNGIQASSGGFSGHSKNAKISAVESTENTIAAKGLSSNAGGGDGHAEYPLIDGFKSTHDVVSAQGDNSLAGIVAGTADSPIEKAYFKIENSNATNSSASASGQASKAGFVAGKIEKVHVDNNNTFQNCTITSTPPTTTSTSTSTPSTTKLKFTPSNVSTPSTPASGASTANTLKFTTDSTTTRENPNECVKVTESRHAFWRPKTVNLKNNCKHDVVTTVSGAGGTEETEIEIKQGSEFNAFAPEQHIKIKFKYADKKN